MQIGVTHLALACCAAEVSLAMQLHLPVDLEGFTIHEHASGVPADLRILVIAGTITHVVAPRIVEIWNQLPEPKVALAYGVCATSGGPYWDSYAVVGGAAELLPVVRFVPGCPPPADTLLDAIVATAREAVTHAG